MSGLKRIMLLVTSTIQMQFNIFFKHMKNINLFLAEKLHLTRDNKGLNGFDDGYETYWFGELNNYKQLPNDFFEHRKSIRKDKEGRVMNKPWYAVIIFLSLNPGSNIETIRSAVWPGKKGQQAELFTALRNLNIIVGKREKSLAPFKDWKTATGKSFHSYKLW